MHKIDNFFEFLEPWLTILLLYLFLSISFYFFPGGNYAIITL